MADLEAGEVGGGIGAETDGRGAEAEGVTHALPFVLEENHLLGVLCWAEVDGCAVEGCACQCHVAQPWRCDARGLEAAYAELRWFRPDSKTWLPAIPYPVR